MFKRNKRTAAQLRPERKKELQLFERHSGIRFRELESLNQAFTHRSFAHESTESGENNERLEFLGDSVLGMVVSEYLYQTLTDQPEGELARIKSFVVSEASLSEIAKRLRVDNFILIGKGEEYSGGRTKKAILADALEAIIGAYYLDSGFMPARRFVREMLIPEINKVLEDRHAKDYKTLLQEYVQKRMKTYPHYRVVQKTGRTTTAPSGSRCTSTTAPTAPARARTRRKRSRTPRGWPTRACTPRRSPLPGGHPVTSRSQLLPGDRVRETRAVAGPSRGTRRLPSSPCRTFPRSRAASPSR